MSASTQLDDRRGRTWRPLIASAIVLGLTLGAVGSSTPATAQDAPTVVEPLVRASVSPSTLYGRDIAVALIAAGESASDAFNLTHTIVIPSGVAFVSGSSKIDGRDLIDPAGVPQPDGSMLLTWTNVSDLLAGTSAELTFALRPDTNVYAVGDVIELAAQTFVSADPRTLPDGSVTAEPDVTAMTRLSPFDLVKTESSAESELLRGLDDHRTVVTLEIQNNLVKPTTGFSIVDHIPAGMEFLGCGTDPTAMTHPCVTPTSVSTVTTDPDGDGPLVADVYTRVEWDSATLAAPFGSADLSPGGTFSIDYVTAIPLRRNVQAAPSGAPIDLENNSGTSTTDEESMVGHARAFGNYDGTLPSSDDDTLQVIAEDLSVHLNASAGTFSHGSATSWSLLVESSQYAIRTAPIVVTQTVPDGLDVIATDPALDAGFPVANADGTLALQWTLPGFDAPNGSQIVRFDTTTRSTYRETGRPVAARDAWIGAVELAATSEVVIDDDGTTSRLPTPDASADRQRGNGPSISKDVARPMADGTCGDGSSVEFTPGIAGPFGPGDRVCWRLTVELPTGLDLLSLVVEDYLPAGFAFDGQTATAANGADLDGAFTIAGAHLRWDLGDVEATAERFQVVVQTLLVEDPNLADPADLIGNLMKVRHGATGGAVYQLRDDADAEWGEPRLDIVSGVSELNDVTVPGAPADGIVVEAGDIVTSTVTVGNSGNLDAAGVSVRHTLPDSIACGAISGISNGGVCHAGSAWIQWDDLTVAAGSTLPLSYDLAVPVGITAAVTLNSAAGVRSYQSATNTGRVFTYVPADNIDASLTSNTSGAKDSWSIGTARPTISATRTTSVSEPGNNAGTQATIGETVSYSYEVTLPKGTTFHGPTTLTSSLGARLDLADSTVRATLDGGVVPNGWSVSDADNSIAIVLATPHVVTPEANQTIRVTFDAVVTDISANARSARIGNSMRLRWTDERGRPSQQSASVTVQIVEPSISLRKSHDDADSVIEPGQTYTSTVTASNHSASQTSTAHDLTVVDTVSPQLTVLDEFGRPVRDGATVGEQRGRWDAQARTITWLGAPMAPGAASSFSYQVKAATPLVADAPIAGPAEATATSIAGASSAERRYGAEAIDSARVSNFGMSSDVITESATIGEAVDVALTVDVPADTIGFDVTVIDTLPIGLRYESLIDFRCDQGGSPCVPPNAAVRTDAGDVAFLLGDVTTPSSSDRTFVITYRAVVAEVPTVTAASVLAQSAAVHFNQRDRTTGTPTTIPTRRSFDSATTAASDHTTIVEPSLTVDKATDTPRRAPGSTLSYSVVVTNSSDESASPAFDVLVTDAPDSRLVDFTDTTASTDVTLLDGDHSDGPLAWLIPGPLLPGASVVISYQLTLPQDLDGNDEIVDEREVLNTADVSSYFGVSASERSDHPGRSYREYADVAGDTVEVELDLAAVGGRVWHDADFDHLRDADEGGLGGVTAIVTYLGPDGRAGGGDDEVSEVLTNSDGIWIARGLPGGAFTVEIDAATVPTGMVASYDSVHGTVSPTGGWSGNVAENDQVVGIDAGFGAPIDDGQATRVGRDGDVWVVALKPDGTALVRKRNDDQTWSPWYQQGTSRSWASMSVNTDRDGNVWVVGVKLTGEALVRTKTADPDVRVGWSEWYQQGSGGWASMSLTTDPSGNVWVVGVKASGRALARVKNATAGVAQGWSGWTHLGSISWSGIATATDTTGQLWLAGVTRGGSSYILRRTVGGDLTANWSSWMQQGSDSDWATLDLATDSENTLWLNGVKEGGTAYLRQKLTDPSLSSGWSQWLQLGGSNSWSSMTLTVDGADALWVAGVKHSGTAFIRMRCVCVGIADGWSGWIQQGAVNSWDSMVVVADPDNRVLLAGMKLGGTAFTRTKEAVPGVNTGWLGWTQHAGANTWDSFSAHSDSWVGLHPPRTPSLETSDDVWIAPVGWVTSSDAVTRGIHYPC